MEYDNSNDCFNCSPRNSSTLDACRDPTTFELNILITFFVCLFLLLGSFGNIVTMLVIVKNKTLHTPTAYFLFSLCISDLTSGLLCSPLWLYRRTWGFCEWNLSEGSCNVYWFADFTTNFATALHILSFALLRFFSIYWPFKVSIITKKRVVIYICALWLIAAVLAMPMFWLTGVVENRGFQRNGAHWPSCSICNNETIEEATCIFQFKNHTLVTSIVFIYIPQIAVIILSCLIAIALLRRRRWRKKFFTVNPASQNIHEKNKLNIEPNQGDLKENRNKKKAATRKQNWPQDGVGQSGETLDVTPQQKPRHAFAKRIQNEHRIFTQLSLIVVSFIIGYSPLTIYEIWTTASNSSSADASGNFDHWFGVVSYLCLRLSECMNPIMYNLGSTPIRKATKKLLKIEK